MGEIPLRGFIENLADDDLRKELQRAGENVGPITPATRKFYQNRLVRRFSSSIDTTQTSEDSDAQNEDGNTVSGSNERTRKSVGSNTKNGVTPLKNESDSNMFFGVHIPKSDSGSDSCEPLVFDTKSEALLIMKGQKNARFKVFENYKNAKEYSLKGVENETQQTEESSNIPKSEDPGQKFPTLKQQDLNKLTRCIENGDLDAMLKLVRSNPRYLISSADGPVSLKPSTRYNALHIAAKANKPEICKEILLLIQNLDFQKLIFPNVDDENVAKYRTQHILDSYLNTPEKILFETPLHFACKLGYKDVVRELISYPSCSTSVLNKSGKRPFDVIGTRGSAGVTISDIEQLLSEHYYVPLLRHQGNTENPIIGEPIMTKQNLSHYLNDMSSPEHSSLTVRALAGPMAKEQAAEFHKSWATPTKRKDLPAYFRYVRRSDSEKGEEQIGRELASKDSVGWTEFWDFLDDFANFSTEDGLEKLENYLKRKDSLQSNTSQDIDDLVNAFGKIHLTPSKEETSTVTPDSTKGSKYDSMESESKINSTNSSLFDSIEPESRIDSTKRSIFDSIESKFNINLVKGSKSDSTGIKSSVNSYPKTTPEIRTPEDSDNTNGHRSLEQTATSTAEVLASRSDASVRLSPSSHRSNATKKVSKECSKMSIDRYSHEELFYRFRDDTCPDALSNTSTLNASDMSDTSSKKGTFLTGSFPTKRDQDVLTAIGGTDIDPDKFPFIAEWKSSILSYSENERQKWLTPRKQQGVPADAGIPNLQFSPSPSSGHNHAVSLTPTRDLRKFLFKYGTPPSRRIREQFS